MIILIRILVLFVIGFISADLSSRIISDKLESSPIMALSQKNQKDKSPNKISYPIQKQIIVERNIFNSNPAPDEPVLPQGELNAGQTNALNTNKGTIEEQKKAAVPTTLRVKLVGTIVGDKNLYSAIIEDLRTRMQDIYTINEFIQDGVPITDIERKKVYIVRDGRMEVIEMYPPKLQPQPTALRQEASLSTGVSDAPPLPVSGEISMVLDKREVESAIENIPQLLTKARIIPHFRGGKTEGFKIFSIVPGSLYEKVGLRNDDIIVKINDMEIKDPSNFLNIFQQLKDDTAISVDLIRKGVKQTMSYEIR